MKPCKPTRLTTLWNDTLCRGTVRFLPTLALGTSLATATCVQSQEAKPGAPPQPDIKSSQYCLNIADAAADARAAWQKETLTALEKDLENRIRQLEAKRAEYEEWLRRRNEFLSKAEDAVVAVYARMKPDAAASQLANMSDESAAAILAKLNTRSASAVLGEMEPARAAQLTTALTSAPRRADAQRKP